MAKKGLDIRSIGTVIKDISTKASWSLCVGAGISKPLLPDWYGLVEKLIQNQCKSADRISVSEFKETGFSPDTMIQAVKNHLKTDDNTFIRMLSEELYAPIKSSLTPEEWLVFIKMHERDNFGLLTKPELAMLDTVVNKLFVNTSAKKIADVIVEARQNNLAPNSILSFNGEAILLSLIQYCYYKKTGRKKSICRRVVNSISYKDNLKMPYIHCHGSIPIFDSNFENHYIGRNAFDKLVFSEEKYLQLANASFSWQSASFIDTCLNNKIVFIGVSLTDGNMRRWLSWMHANKMQEFSENSIDTTDSTEHFWINIKPRNAITKTWIEESVAHLGIRLIWIDNWSQLDTVLRKMLGLSKKHSSK